jgi:hypothetical protein
LFELLNGKNLRLYPSDELRQQALYTTAVETPPGWRIAYEKASKKIDAIVTLAMASVAAFDRPAQPPLYFFGGACAIDSEEEQKLHEQALRRAQDGRGSS